MAELTVAVDFGTSNTVAVGGRDGRDSRVVTLDGAPRMPSAIFAAPNGALVVGADAIRMARGAPNRVELRPKARIDEGTLLLGAVTVDVTTVVRAVLAKVCAAAATQFDAPVGHLVLTHPADWGALRIGTLTTAAAGLAGRVSLVPEPVAAAARHGVPAGVTVLVLDVGGGTCDAAAVRRDSTGYRVLACAGLPDLGGDDIDQRVVDHVVARRPELARLTSSGSTDDRRDWLLLRHDARTAKELLSRHPYAEVASHGVAPVRIDQTEFDALIAADVDRAVGLLTEVRGTAAVDSVHLVGGSSRLRPLVSAIGERTGLDVHPAREPEMCVAEGALLLGGSAAVTRPAETGRRPAPRPRWRTPLTAGGAALLAIVLVVALLSGAGDHVTGSATPASAARPTEPSRPADTVTLPPAEPGDELVTGGEPEREVLAAGQRGQYTDSLDDVTVEVGLDSVAVSQRAAPPGMRWIRVQATGRHLGTAGQAPFEFLGLFLALLDDRGQHIDPPPGRAEDCQGTPPSGDNDSLPPGATGTVCADFLVPKATPVSAVVFGDEPRTFGNGGDTPLQWPADVPADGPAPALPEPVGEIGGDPVEVAWVGDFVTVQFDLVDEPSGYFPEPDFRPGSRVVLLRALVTASGTGEIDLGRDLFDYLGPVDDRGLRITGAWDEFVEPVDCPLPETLPPGDTRLVCGTYILAADTPIRSFALGVEEDVPDAWQLWTVESG